MINKIDLLSGFTGNVEELTEKQIEKRNRKRNDLEQKVIKGMEMENLYASVVLDGSNSENKE
jgi:hypothetical protein